MLKDIKKLLKLFINSPKIKLFSPNKINKEKCKEMRMMVLQIPNNMEINFSGVSKTFRMSFLITFFLSSSIITNLLEFY